MASMERCEPLSILSSVCRVSKELQRSVTRRVTEYITRSRPSTYQHFSVRRCFDKNLFTEQVSGTWTSETTLLLTSAIVKAGTVTPEYDSCKSGKAPATVNGTEIRSQKLQKVAGTSAHAQCSGGARVQERMSNVDWDLTVPGHHRVYRQIPPCDSVSYPDLVADAIPIREQRRTPHIDV